ncbi:beta-N-acetylhexosaminidase [Exiguobacterium antarcticum]|uniref:Beta-N-acetylhexosaminidase n=1 Tax=Exiguobacterium antarcticum TaxID=132920 RepID=A0ABT6R1S4_9BACL|nr:beta-N-acetylhexosaminidase [Exiguobacterium antarcticum]MDI3234266.1 beta-N-acetylhexosaminidase [Exiguobacterium antarcticum]
MVPVLLASVLLAGCADEPAKPAAPEPKPAKKTKPPQPDRPSAAERAEKQLKETISKMSTAEKVDQLLYIGVTGTALTQADRQLLQDHALGGVLLLGGNITSTDQLKTFTAAIGEAQTADEKAFLGFDEEGGRVSRVPDARLKLSPSLSFGHKNDPGLMKEVGRTLGSISRFYGFNMDFAPVLDVNSNPANPIIGDRALSADPQQVARLGVPLMQGMKEEDIVPVVKHFPGHGDTTVDSHVGLPRVDATKAELEQTELVPFKRAIQDGAEMVMVAHILFPALDKNRPSSLSKEVMTGVLRSELKFDGVIITDDLVMGAITERYGLAQAAGLALENGADMAMFSSPGAYASVHKEIMARIKQGKLSAADLNQKVMRVLRLKQTYDLSQTKRVDEYQRLIEQVKAVESDMRH